MKGLPFEPLSHKCNGLVHVLELPQCEWSEQFPSRNAGERCKVLTAVALLRTAARETVTDRHAVGCHIAHQPKVPGAHGAEVSAHINNQNGRLPQCSDRRVGRSRYINPYNAEELAYTDVA